jgi:O-antigen/teichoic acid export membrane protein
VLVYLAFLRALYRDVTPVPTEATLRDLFRNSIPLGATDIVNTLNGGLDLWLIIIFFSTVEVAEYQQGAWQIPIITTIAYSLGSVYLPRYALLYREGKYAEVIALWRQSTEKVALIVVPASLIFFVAAEELITLFFTDAYLGAAPVFQCYTLLTMGRVTAFGNLMVAAGRPRDVLKSSFLTLLSTVALSVPLVMTVGFLGPALGTALSYIPAVTIYCWFIAKAYNVRLRDTFPGVAYFKVVAAAIPACWLAWQIKEVTELHAAVEIGMIAAIVGIVYAITATVAGLIGRAEWKIARDFIALRVLR